MVWNKACSNEKKIAETSKRIEVLNSLQNDLLGSLKGEPKRAVAIASLIAETEATRVDKEWIQKTAELEHSFREEQARLSQAIDEIKKDVVNAREDLENEKRRLHQAWLDEEIVCSGNCNGTTLRRRDFLKLPDWADGIAHVAGRRVHHVCPQCFRTFSSGTSPRDAEKAFV